MMSKPTPGPWIRNMEHSDSNAGVRVESEHEHGEVNDGWVICTCEGPDAEANGLLLAASHDTLEICEAMARRIIDCPDCDGTGKEPRALDDACRNCGGYGEVFDVMPTICEVRDAIARARGEERL